MLDDELPPVEDSEPKPKDETEPPPSEADADEQAQDTPEDDRESLEAQNAELTDKLQRTLAELENTRRRFEREKQELTRYAVAGFAADILNLADNLERALNAVPPDAREGNSALDNFITGVELSAKELSAVFERHQIAKIDPKGEAFSYNHHQAVSEIVSDDYPPGTVAEVLQPGYILHDRLIRPAMVVVVKAG